MRASLHYSQRWELTAVDVSDKRPYRKQITVADVHADVQPQQQYHRLGDVAALLITAALWLRHAKARPECGLVFALVAPQPSQLVGEW
ncbi:hypothetical protein GCM10027277_45570 [Pseudoduganella ginsengisoli]